MCYLFYGIWLKVTHVVFRDGYPKTYNTAIQRNIPLVSACWVEKSILAKKLMDPVDYPPINMEKYTKPREYKFKFNLKVSWYLIHNVLFNFISQLDLNL